MNIYEKIAKVQDEVMNITKDAQNPHFGNTYATYEKVMNVLHPVLRKYNLVINHGFEKPLFEGQMAVTTRITDFKSEEPQTGIVSTLYLPVTKLDPQQSGSAITYAKRYMVLAMFGLGTEDDDGESGSAGSQNRATAPNPAQTALPTMKNPSAPATPKQIEAIYKMAKHAGADLQDIKMDYKVTSIEDLSIAQASDAIKRLGEM